MDVMGQALMMHAADPPNWGFVTLQSDFDGADASMAAFLDDTGVHTITPADGLDNANLLFGTTSLLSVNTTTGAMLSGASGKAASWNFGSNAPFTIEYWLKCTDTGSNYQPLNTFFLTGTKSWVIRHASTHIHWFYSTDGSDTQVASFVFPGTTTATRYRWTRTGTNLRLCVDGTFHSKLTLIGLVQGTQDLAVNTSGAGQNSWLDTLRINNGIDLSGDTDSSYTLDTGPFPIGS